MENWFDIIPLHEDICKGHFDEHWGRRGPAGPSTSNCADRRPCGLLTAG